MSWIIIVREENVKKKIPFPACLPPSQGEIWEIKYVI